MAAQDIQQLLLQVDATTELMRRELAKAATETDQWAERTEKAANKAGGSFDVMGDAADFTKGAIKGFIAAISVDAILSAGSAILNFADNLDAAAEKAGLTAERYQTLKEGLRALEVDGEQADKIFQRLQDTLGAVQGGTAAKGVTEALDKMGITSRIKNGDISDTAGLFDAIAASAGRFKTQAEFVSAVVDIVGRKLGIDLATAVKDGGIALKGQEMRFSEAGDVISDEYIAKLADANEAIDVFTTRAKVRLTIWSAETLGILERLGVAFGKITGTQDTSTRSATIEASMKAREQRESLEAGRFGFIPVSGQEIANARAEEDRLSRLLLKQEAQNPALTDPMTRLFPLKSDGTFGTGTATPGLSAAEKKAAAAAAAAAKKAAAAAAKAAANFDPFDKKNLTASENRMGFTEKLSDLPAPAPSYSQPLIELDAMQKSLGEIKAISVDISKIKIIDPEQSALAQKFTSDLSSGLGQALVYGQSLGDALINSIKAAAAELISSQLLKLLGGGGDGGGGIIGAAFKGLGALFGGGRAAGGPVEPGTTYLVGENRPEMFIPSTRGRIASRVPDGAGGSQMVRVAVDVAPSPLFITATRVASAQAGQQAAAEQSRISNRRRLPGGLG